MTQAISKGVEAIAEHIDESPRRTYYLLTTGQIPGYKLGGWWYLRHDTYEEFLRKLESGEAA